jgi:cytochrome P450
LLKARNGDFAALRTLLEEAPDAFYVRTPIGRIVYLNSPELVESLLVSNHKHYHKDTGYAALRKAMGNGLVTSEGEFHLRQRRMIQPAFHKKRIDEYGEHMVHYARERGEGWTDGATMDVNAEMMAVTLKVIAKTMFDADVADEIEKVYEAVNVMLKYFERYVNPTIGKMFDSLPLESTRRLRESEKNLDEIIYRFIRERRENPEDKGDLLSMLLMAQGDDGSGMTDAHVRDECITLFLAGHETTAVGLSWTWYLLSQHPEIEARLHEELDRVLEGGRAATAADVPQLDYTRRVLAESMRVRPPVPGFGRQAIRDNMLGAYQIFEGDNIVVSPYALQMRKEWFPEPDSFDPDRWLPERSAGIPKFAYFPFGGGVRKCIGEPFAWMEGILLLATFAQQWKFRLAPDAKIGMDVKVTLRPKYGMKMSLHRR